MNRQRTLTVSSLLAILLTSCHLADDIVRGMEPGGPSTLAGVVILVAWLYGTLVLADRPSGYVVVLLGSLVGAGATVVHTTGAGFVGGRIANSSGVFLWVWTLIALGVTATFSVVLSVRELWNGRPAARRTA